MSFALSLFVLKAKFLLVLVISQFKSQCFLLDTKHFSEVFGCFDHDVFFVWHVVVCNDCMYKNFVKYKQILFLNYP